jgi:DNA replication protein DnaC
MTSYDFSKSISANSGIPSKLICEKHGTYLPISQHHPICPECAITQHNSEDSAKSAASLPLIEAAWLKTSGVPPRYANSGFKNFMTSNAGQLHALNALIKFSNAVRHGYTGSVILTGKTGNGKTHLGVGVLKNVIAVIENRHLLSGLYITSADLGEYVAGAWKREFDNESKTLNRLSHKTDILVIDEYGLDDQREQIKRLVDRVLRARYDAQKPTVLISNLPPEELKSKLGDRVWSRLLESDDSRVIKFNWADQRTSACAPN